MAWLNETLSSSVGKKMMMALSGALLGLFLLVHLIGNSTIFFGRAAFVSYADHLHSLGALISVAEIGLLAIFVTHIVFGLAVSYENYTSRPDRYHVEKSSGGRTIGSRTMLYTGLLTLVFVFVHLANFHFIPKNSIVADLMRETLSNPGYAAFYIVAVLGLAVHVSHGFWSLFQSLGLDHPKYTPIIKGCACVGSIVIGLVFTLIPLYALFCSQFLV